jgi:phosphate transport system protein
VLSDTWSHGMEAAIDMTLLGRYYERFADHAVSVARRVVYLVTGERGAVAAASGS